MIGVCKRVIIVNMGIVDLVMYNPVITRRDGPCEAEEGRLSLDGVRSALRYRDIEVEFLDDGWKTRRQRYSGRIAQIVQHEMDHLGGIVI